MENVDAVAYADDVYLKPKNEFTEYIKNRLAYVSLHELAH